MIAAIGRRIGRPAGIVRRSSGTSETLLPRLATPASLSASGSLDGSWSATWDAVTDADGYEIRLDSGAWTDNGATPEASGTGLTVGAHSFQVRAYGTGFRKSFAASDPFTISLPQLETPTGITLPDSTDGTWTANWSPVDNATGYEWRVPEVSTTWTATSMTSAGGTLPNGEYTFELRATADGYLSSEIASDAFNVSITLPQLDTPAPTVADSTDGSWSASWSAITGATGYVYRIITSPGAIEAVDWTSTSSASASGTGLGDGDYEFQVYAVGAGYADSDAGSDPFSVAISGGGFDPTFGGARALAFWVKGDQLVDDGAEDGDPIATWADQSGNERTATQSTFSKRPTLTVDGVAYAAFDGVDDEMALFNPSSMTEATIFAVVSADAEGSLWDFNNLTPDAEFYPFSGAIYETFGSTVRRDAIAPGVTLSSRHLYSVSAKSGEWIARHNGAAIRTVATNTVFFANTVASLGASFAFGYRFSGGIAEIILYSETLTTADREAVEDYLGSKYGLTITH